MDKIKIATILNSTSDSWSNPPARPIAAAPLVHTYAKTQARNTSEIGLGPSRCRARPAEKGTQKQTGQTVSVTHTRGHVCSGVDVPLLGESPLIVADCGDDLAVVQDTTCAQH